MLYIAKIPDLAEFDPLVLKKNSGVIYVGIQYLVLFSGVTFTPVFEIQKNIISCFVRKSPRQAKVHNFTSFSGVTFTPAIWTSPLDCPGVNLYLRGN